MLEKINQAIGNMVLNPGVGHKYSGFTEDKKILTIAVDNIEGYGNGEPMYNITQSENGVETKNRILKSELKEVIKKANLAKI